MQVLTKDLSGPALDWAVASCGLKGRRWEDVHFGNFRVSCGKLYLNTVVTLPYSPSTDWAQGGPIIDRLFKQGLRLHTAEYMTGIHNKELLVTSLDSPNGFWFGPTPLVAAMRCYVASKLGDSVEIPDSLAS